MPSRIQLSRKRGAKLPPGTIVVSRPTKFGNPFDWRDMLGDTPELKKQYACEKYRHWLIGGCDYGRYNERQWILEHLHLIREAEYVACWCKESDFCHADILIELAEAVEMSQPQ